MVRKYSAACSAEAVGGREAHSNTSAPSVKNSLVVCVGGLLSAV